MLPNEKEITDRIESELIDDLSFSESLTDFAAKLISQIEFPVETRNDLSPDCIHVALNVFAEAIRTYESIIILCRKGLESQANILLRTLVEGTFALDFLLRENFPLTGYPSELKAGREILDADFRRKMYCARLSLNEEKQIKDLERQGLLENINQEIESRVEKIHKDSEFWDKEIGKNWVDQVRKTSFSGLSIEQLADNLGLKPVYSTLIRTGSRSVHVNVGQKYTEIDYDNQKILVNLEPSIEFIPVRLYCTVLMFISGLDDLNKNLHLEMGTEVDELKKKIKGMSWKKN